MAFAVSPGVYDTIIDKSFTVDGGASTQAGIVITSYKGPTAVNYITSVREFLEIYGIPTGDSKGQLEAIRFLQTAGPLYIRRVIEDATVASGELED